MRMFMIEAYGGPLTTDGAVHHFAVQAESADEAIRLIRDSIQGALYGRFDIVEIGDEIGAEEAAIVSDGAGAYRRWL